MAMRSMTSHGRQRYKIKQEIKGLQKQASQTITVKSIFDDGKINHREGLPLEKKLFNDNKLYL